MNKEELKESILYFAKKYDKEYVYTWLTESVQFPELVKMIILLMFENKFNYYHCSDVDYDNYKRIFDYQTEMSKTGYYEFKL